MFLSRHKAVVAGLTLTLSLGAVAASPKTASASDAQIEDKSLDYQDDNQGVVASLASLFSTRSSSLTPVALSDEMKYFSLYESGKNYDQGFSSGDGYNAMGYYQFDRRYSLVQFMQQVYAYNSQTYAMFAPVIARGAELKSGAIYSNGSLTEIGKLASDAWHAAYAANPSEFSALQDSFAYNEYYLPVQNILKNSYGIDISGRADCVKGLTWGMCNLFGSGGVRKFLTAAELKDSMSDREIVTALCDAVVSYYKTGAGSSNKYAAGYINRYTKEKATCLKYIAEDEQQAEQQKPTQPDTPSTPGTDGSQDGSGSGDGSGSDSGNGSGSDSGSTDSGSSGTPSEGENAGGNGGSSDNGGSGDGGSGDAGSDNGGSGSTDSGSADNGSTDGSGSGSGSTDGGSTDTDSGSKDEQGGSSDEKPAATVTGIAIDAKKPGCKIGYTAGEAFDPTGLELTLTKSDGTTQTVAYGEYVVDEVTFSVAPGTVFKDAGSQEITVTYQEAGSNATQTASFMVTVSAKQAGSEDAGNGSGSGDEDSKKDPVTRKHTVTFTVKGETFDTQEVADGDAAHKPTSAPWFDGYTFVGWYLNGVPYDFGTEVTGDLTLVAYFQRTTGASGETPTLDEQQATRAATKADLPQTGDPSAILMLGGAGAAMVGTSLTALGVKRRKKDEPADK